MYIDEPVLVILLMLFSILVWYEIGYRVVMYDLEIKCDKCWDSLVVDVEDEK